MAAAEHPRCEICESRTEPWARILGYTYHRCSACAHLFVFPRPPREILDALYQQASYYDPAERQSDRLHRYSRRRAVLLGRLCDSLGLPKRVLDVGCASGIFLEEALQQGWQAEGIEPSVALSEKARARTGTRIHLGTAASLPEQIGPFPVVTAWDVIEHALDPRSFFRQLVQHVGPGGLVALSTPLIDGLPAAVMGRRFPMLTPPEHLSLFSRASLKRLAGEFGGAVAHFSTFSNLDAHGLASGLSKLLWHQKLEDIGAIARCCVFAVAAAGAWVPALVDRAGYGTEMLVVFRCSRK